MKTWISLLGVWGALNAGAVNAQSVNHTELHTTQEGRAASSEAAPIASIEAFTTSTMRFTHLGNAQLYVLDDLQQLEAELSQGLPANEQQAMPIARQRWKEAAPQIQNRAANAAVRQLRAQGYGIERVPAVVFNGRTVVYGVTDVAQAQQAYEQGQGVAVAAPRFEIERR